MSPELDACGDDELPISHAPWVKPNREFTRAARADNFKTNR